MTAPEESIPAAETPAVEKTAEEIQAEKVAKLAESEAALVAINQKKAELKAAKAEIPDEVNVEATRLRRNIRRLKDSLGIERPARGKAAGEEAPVA